MYHLSSKAHIEEETHNVIYKFKCSLDMFIYAKVLSSSLCLAWRHASSISCNSFRMLLRVLHVDELMDRHSLSAIYGSWLVWTKLVCPDWMEFMLQPCP